MLLITEDQFGAQDGMKFQNEELMKCQYTVKYILSISEKLPVFKGALSWYGKLTWESAHASNLIILCLLIVWGMTFIFMVHLSFYAIPLLIDDVMYDITTIP